MARILDLEDHSFGEFELPLRLPHSLMRSYSNPDEIIAFEFMGGAAKVNLKTGATVKKEGSTESLFHGHGVQSRDGKTLWTTEFLVGSRSQVRARRAEDLSLIDEVEGFSGGHHIIALPGSEMLVSGGTSEKGENFLAFFDAEKGRLTQSLPMKDVMGHLLAFSPTEVIGVSNAVLMDEKQKSDLKALIGSSVRPARLTNEINLDGAAPLIYANLQGELRSFWEQGREDLFHFGFGLDLIPGSPGRYLTTHHKSDAVIVWDKFKLLKVIPVAAPLGIVVSADGSEFLVLSQGRIEVFSTTTFQRIKTLKYDRPVSLLSRYS